MSVHAQLPDGTILEFPDSTPDAIIDGAVKGHIGNAFDSAYNSNPDLGNSIGHAMGVTGIAPVRAAAGFIPASIDVGYNAMDWAANKLLGSPRTEPPHLNQQVQEFLTRQGLPSPQNSVENYLNAGSQGSIAGPVGILAGLGAQAGSDAPVSNEPIKIGNWDSGISPKDITTTAGGLIGGGAGSLTKPRATESIVNQATKGVTPEQFALAKQLQQQSYAQNVPLSSSEAIQASAKGGSGFGAVQRVVENSPQTQAHMSQFYAGRPEGNTAYADKIFDAIAPVNSRPSEIAHAVQGAAQGLVDKVNTKINQAEGPYYTASRNVPLSETSYPLNSYHSENNNLLQQSPYAEQLRKLRGDPILNRNVADLPNNTVGVANQIIKNLGDQAEAAKLSGERELSGSYQGAKQDLIAQASEASPDFAIAKQLGSTLRQGILDPLKRSPLGQLAETPNLEGQLSTLFPSKPLAGSEKEIGNAVSGITGMNPDAAKNLVRQHLEQNFDTATKNLVSGQNQGGGAKYAAGLTGNRQSASNLESAIRALPDGANKWQQVSGMLDQFKAQGYRIPQGSATSFNDTLQKELSRGEVVGKALSEGLSPESLLSMASRKYTQFRYGKNVSSIADLLTNPEGVSTIEEMAKSGSAPWNKKLAEFILKTQPGFNAAGSR